MVAPESDVRQKYAQYIGATHDIVGIGINFLLGECFVT